jgi:undecaprenyl-diphosphatase
VVALLAFAGFVLLVCRLGSVESADAYVAGLADAFRRAVPPNRMAIWVSRLAAQVSVGLVVLGVVVSRRRGRPWAEIAQHLLVLGLGLLLFEGCRSVLYRYRPGGPLIHPIPNSFPSGHVANAVLCIVTAAHLVVPERSRRGPLRIVVFAAGTMFVGVVAFARIYFGLHWFSDIVASLLFGTMFAAVLEVRRKRDLDARLVLPALALLYGAAAFDVRVVLPSPVQAETKRPVRAAAHRPRPVPTPTPTAVSPPEAK